MEQGILASFHYIFIGKRCLGHDSPGLSVFFACWMTLIQFYPTYFHFTPDGVKWKICIFLILKPVCCIFNFWQLGKIGTIEVNKNYKKGLVHQILFLKQNNLYFYNYLESISVILLCSTNGFILILLCFLLFCVCRQGIGTRRYRSREGPSCLGSSVIWLQFIPCLIPVNVFNP